MVAAAMLPHARPPYYFRGQGSRFRRDASRAAHGVTGICGEVPPVCERHAARLEAAAECE